MVILQYIVNKINKNGPLSQALPIKICQSVPWCTGNPLDPCHHFTFATYGLTTSAFSTLHLRDSNGI